MALYKYCNSWGKLIIQNLEIKATPPNELDDECEVRPDVIDSDPMASAKRRLDDMLADPSVFNSNVEMSRRMTFVEFKAFAKAARDKILAEIVKASPKTADHLRSEWVKINSKRWGLVSLTTSPCVDAMWERYADGDKGLVVEFDEANSRFVNLSLVECTYCDIPVVFDMAKKRDIEAIEQIARQKKTRFFFEKESRLIVPLSECRKDPQTAPVLNLYRLDPSAIVSVTFGVRTPDLLRREVLTALTRPELQHVTKWRMGTTDGGTDNMTRTRLS